MENNTEENTMTIGFQGRIRPELLVQRQERFNPQPVAAPAMPTSLTRDELVTKAVAFTKALSKRYNIVGGGRISRKDFENDTMEELLKLSEQADADAAKAGAGR
jgi:hypothetical protein